MFTRVIKIGPGNSRVTFLQGLFLPAVCGILKFRMGYDTVPVRNAGDNVLIL
jgi:hypothetical protein